MTNNSNPYDLDADQVRSKTWDTDVVRARVIDVLPEIHAVRVNPRGDNAPIVAPVLTPNYGSHTLPSEDTRVMLLYITANTPVVLGGIYLLDGEEPPTIEKGDIRIGNETESFINIGADGEIDILTEGNEPVNIDHQSAVAKMSADQQINGNDQYYILNFDTAHSDPDGLFDASENGFVVRSDGQHEISGTAEVPTAGQNNEYTLAVFRNDTLLKRKNAQSSVNASLSLDVDAERNLNSGDVIDIRLRQNSGSQKTVSSDFVATEFSINRHGI